MSIREDYTLHDFALRICKTDVIFIDKISYIADNIVYRNREETLVLKHSSFINQISGVRVQIKFTNQIRRSLFHDTQAVAYGALKWLIAVTGAV